MTTEDTSRAERADEMELDLFLQKKGMLSRGLLAIDQPKSSAAMEASIFAAIEAELAKDLQSEPPAANDPHAGAGVGPARRRFSPLWNIALGLAAGVLLTVLLQKARYSDDVAAPPMQTAQIDSPKPPQVAQREVPAVISTPAGSDRPAGKTHPVTPLPRASGTQPPHAPVIEENKVQRVEITGSIIRRVDAETPSPVQIIVAEDLKKSPDVVQNSAQDEPTPCEPIPKKDDLPHPAEDAAQEQACLNLITAKLDAGAGQQALEEWEKFRKAYPDFVAPATISTRIKDLQKVQK